ncbi:MAG: HAD family hydrolase [Phormidesmis sp.]
MPERNFSLRVATSSEHGCAAEQVVFCDFDGPIVDVSERYYQTYRQGLLSVDEYATGRLGRSLNLRPLSKAQFWKMKQNRVADLEIAIRSGLPADLFEPFMQQVQRIVNHPSLLNWDCLQPTALSALRYFKARGVRVVLVTLRHPRQVQAFLEENSLVPLVAEVHGALDVNAAHANRVEQKRELLAEAIAQQQARGYNVQKSWMVGDTEADVLAGQTMGLDTAALSCGVRSEGYLRQLQPSKIYKCLMSAARDLMESTVLQAA